MVDYTYECETLSNGLRFCWLNLPQVHSSSVHAFVQGGPVYETKANNGVSHLLEHLHMVTTRRYPTCTEHQRALADIPGSFNACTRPDCLEFSFTVSPDCLAEAGRHFTEILESRPFSESIIEAEKRLILSELASNEDDFMDGLRAALFGNHAFALPSPGTRRSLARLSTDQVNEADRLCFAPSRVTVACAGSLPGDQLDRLRGHLAELEGTAGTHLDRPSTPKLRLPSILGVSPYSRTRAPLLVIGFIVQRPLSLTEHVVLEVLGMGLSAPFSPLFEPLRYVSTNTYEFQVNNCGILDHNILFLYALVAPRQRDLFVSTVLKQFARLRQGDSDASWFESARRRFQFFVECAKDSPEQLAQRIGMGESSFKTDGVFTVDEELERLRELRPADLVRTAQTLCVQDNLFLFFTKHAWRLRNVARIRRLVRRYL